MSTWARPLHAPHPGFSTEGYAIGSPNPHQVPFRAPHATPQAIAFGFGGIASGHSATASSVAGLKRLPGPGSGFGFGITTGTGAGNMGLGSSAAVATAPTQATFRLTQPRSHSPSLPLNRRRRRSESPSPSSSLSAGEEMHEDENASPGLKTRQVKRMRGGGNGDTAATKTEGDTKKAGRSGTVSATEEVDLGKMLSHLSQPELLRILTSLATSSPSAKSSILTLLPPPSLDAFCTHLSTLETTLLASIPSSGRAEYVWGRARVGVEGYVSECRAWLSLFCPHPASSSVGASLPLANSDASHPSTTFQFLAKLTSSLRRVEASLPPPLLPPAPPSSWPTLPNGRPLNPTDPLSSTLVPLVVNAWHLWIRRVRAEVDGRGRVVGEQMVRTWIREIEGLVIPAPEGFGWQVKEEDKEKGAKEDGVCRVAMEGVKARVVGELGWMAGLKPAGGNTRQGAGGVARQSSVVMDDDEEI